jgi:hypothetical protein
MFLLTIASGQVQAQQDGRYTYKYLGDFFNTCGTEIDFDASTHRKICILVTNLTPED